MARILAIDYGLKRTGLAATDPLQIVASPLETVPTQELKKWLKNYLENEDVETVVVGMALNSEGEDTDSSPHIRGFLKRISKEFPTLQIETVDESFSTRDAQEALIQAGTSKKKRREKGLKDRIAATLILQSYLDRH